MTEEVLATQIAEKLMCVKVISKVWYHDNGCSRHITRDDSKFLYPRNKGSDIYGENNKRKIIGIGKVDNLSKFNAFL
ncbi:hypothetical protein Lal_00028446 [Lupinus albus]|nr:hypothetical protein Lal_00028446 [Lupinus albus]